MSLPFPVSSSSNKRKRPRVEEGEGSGEPDPGDLEIGPSNAPAHRNRLHGQGFNATEKRSYGQRPNYTAADETQGNRTSTASAIARSILNGVKESANSYPSLKSVAEDLCIILDNCEVCPPLRAFNR